jgi:hypothetical protein
MVTAAPPRHPISPPDSWRRPAASARFYDLMQRNARMTGLCETTIATDTCDQGRAAKGTYMRALILAVLLAMLAGTAALAQSADPNMTVQRKPATTGIAPREAPVGHRQPRASDLPPGMRQGENVPGRATDPFGPIPNLCNGC